jgi:pyruvate dehydrogenase E1 component alpha subunit
MGPQPFDPLAAHALAELVRRFEERAGQMFGLGLIAGHCHLSIGHEAAIAGVAQAIGPQDALVAGHRAHGWALARGVDPAALMAELAGRATGLAGGKGGSIHAADPARGWYGGQGLLGHAAAIALGLGFARAATEGVAVAALGDVASATGVAQESFGLAARLRLPVVFLVEDHGGEGPDLGRRGLGLDLAGRTVDGADAAAVHAAAAAAVAAARAGLGPTLLALRLRRARGHSMAAPARYAGRGEDRRFRADDDPLNALARLARAAGASDETLAAASARARRTAGEAAARAASGPEPDAAALLRDVVA